MSSKINILSIIKGHLWTFRDRPSDNLSILDLVFFFAVPGIVAGYAGYSNFLLSKDVVNNIVTAGVLLSGLLLNLIVLVYNLKEKLPKVDSNKPNHVNIQLKHSVLKELYYNISYSTIVSFLMLLAAIAHHLLKGIKLSENEVNSVITDPLIIFLGINLVLSFFMIIKRTYKLLISDD